MTNRRDESEYGHRWLRLARAFAFVAVALMFGALTHAGGAVAQESQVYQVPTPIPSKGGAFTICDHQTYALCATAKCTMFNKVAYCTCDVKHGKSISLSQDYNGGDVCTFNAQGRKNGYMVSTFSTPPSVIKPKGDEAIYTCPADTSDGTYAQCDGGVCFRSSQGQHFPGTKGKIAKDEIICACPTTTADPSTAKKGYQIVGPYPCQKDFFKYCKKKVSNTKNGSEMYVGAPAGSATYLTEQLYGKVPPINRCLPPNS